MMAKRASLLPIQLQRRPRLVAGLTTDDHMRALEDAGFNGDPGLSPG